MENSVLLPCYYVFSTTKMNVDVLQPTLIQSFNSFRVQNDTLFKIRGGDSAYERDGDARRKFWIKPLKETDLGVAQAFFDP